MRPRPLRMRIIDALLLAPMTVDQLSRCLSVTKHAVWLQAEVVRQSGEIVRERSRPRQQFRSANRYRIAA